MRKTGYWNVFEIGWLITFTAVAVALTIIWKDTLFGLFVFITGVLCVVLTAKGSIWCYLFGVFNTLGYAYLSYTNQLFGELGLNMLFFLPMNFVGFAMWRKHMETKTDVKMEKMGIKGIALTLAICIISITATGFGLSLIKTQNTPYLDATTNVLSIIATILTIRRFREQWLLYIILNVFTIMMWSIRTANGSPDGPMMIVMWSAYLVNAFYGYYNWTKGANERQKVEATV